MTAVFVSSSPLGFSSTSLYLTTAVVMLVAGAVVPARIRHDRRSIAWLLILLVLGVIGQPAYAAYTSICDWAWWALECWLFR